MDYFIKFHIFFLMNSKEVKEVVVGLKEFLCSMFGLPYILHADNGREFVNNITVDTVEA